MRVLACTLYIYIYTERPCSNLEGGVPAAKTNFCVATHQGNRTSQTINVLLVAGALQRHVASGVDSHQNRCCPSHFKRKATATNGFAHVLA